MTWVMRACAAPEDDPRALTSTSVVVRFAGVGRLPVHNLSFTARSTASSDADRAEDVAGVTPSHSATSDVFLICHIGGIALATAGNVRRVAGHCAGHR